MSHEDDLPAEVRRQDEEAELQMAAHLAELRQGAETTHEDLPAEVRQQDEEAEQQVAAQLAELRTDEDVTAARRRWSDLSKRTRTLLITAAVADGALRVAALIDIKRRPESQIRGQKRVWTAAVAIINSAGVLPISYFVFGQRRQP
jgi:cation transport regulator ChaB